MTLRTPPHRRPAAPSATPTAGPTCRPRLWSRRDTAIVTLLMVLALIRGLLYAGVQWPWYTPDEPDHVEYALLTRLHGPLVGREHLSQPLRFAIATSLYEWNVYEAPPPGGDLSGLWTGQVGRQPLLYYVLAGWASAGAPAGDLVAQVYAMRVLSAVIGALIVAAAYLAGRLLDPSTPLAGIGLAGVSLFQTTIGALAGAVTNDGLAILGVTLVLVTAIALVRAPVSARRYAIGAAALVATLAIALLAKKTAVVAVPAGLVALLLAGWPATGRWLAGRRLLRPAVAIGLIGLVALPLAFVEYRPDQASAWSATGGARVVARPALAGDHAVLLGGDGERGEVVQELPAPQTALLHGRQATFGAWLRLAQPGQPQRVSLHLRQRIDGKPFTSSALALVGEEWRFASVTAWVAPEAAVVALSVTPETPVPGGVFLDAAVLTEGEPTGAPDPATSADLVHWSGVPARNLLSNPSYEAAPWRPRPWVDWPVQALTGRQLDHLLDRISRLGAGSDEPEKWSLWMWEIGLQTVWGRLGRLAELTMPRWWYAAHALVLAAAVTGALFAGARALWRRQVRSAHLKIGTLSSLILIAAALITCGPYILDLYPGAPFGRYFLVALVPLAGLYVSGLVWVWPRPARGMAALLLLGVMAALDAYVLFYALPLHFSIGLPRIQ